MNGTVRPEHYFQKGVPPVQHLANATATSPDCPRIPRTSGFRTGGSSSASIILWRSEWHVSRPCLLIFPSVPHWPAGLTEQILDVCVVCTPPKLSSSRPTKVLQTAGLLHVVLLRPVQLEKRFEGLSLGPLHHHKYSGVENENEKRTTNNADAVSSPALIIQPVIQILRRKTNPPCPKAIQLGYPR